jgi:hypothetical protein
MTHTAPSASAPHESREAITAHADSYHRFMLGLKWTVVHLAALIVLLVVWFATPAGFLAGLVAGAAAYGAGVYAMTRFLAHSTERDNPGALEPDRG